jgi:hypothetical protein
LSSSSSVKQMSLTTLFGTTGSAKAQASLARLLTRGSIGYNIVTWPEFKEFLTDVGWTVGQPTKQSVKQSVLQQSSSLRARLIDRLRPHSITVAADGWTNVNHEKVTNVCLIADGVAYYWCSIVNQHDRNDAEWMADRLCTLPWLNSLSGSSLSSTLRWPLLGTSISAMHSRGTHRTSLHLFLTRRASRMPFAQRRSGLLTTTNH